MCPANPRDGQDVASGQKTGARRLILADLPRLQALVSGPGGEEILAELHTLLNREPQRALRFQRQLFARISADPGQPTEVAVVHDVSRSGVRLQVAPSAHLDVVQARTVSIEMRLPGIPSVIREATLVRVVEHHENGVELAFSFVEAAERDSAFEAMIERLAAAAAPGGR